MLTQKEANAILGVKECSKCGRTKALIGFYKRKRSRDGHCSDCKQCNNKARLDRLHKAEIKQAISSATAEAKREAEAYDSLVMNSLEPVEKDNLFEWVIFLSIIGGLLAYMILDGVTK